MKRLRYVLCGIAFVAIGVVIGLTVGRRESETEVDTFYASILEIEEGRLLVEGLSVNDINYRGQFRFTVGENTNLEWRSTPMTLSDLKVGATISITYTGSVKESSPAIIDNVLKIQLLDDEKA